MIFNMKALLNQQNDNYLKKLILMATSGHGFRVLLEPKTNGDSSFKFLVKGR